MHLVYPPKILHNRFFPVPPGYYSRTKRNRRQRLCKIGGGGWGGGKQGSL